MREIAPSQSSYLKMPAAPSSVGLPGWFKNAVTSLGTFSAHTPQTPSVTYAVMALLSGLGASPEQASGLLQRWVAAWAAASKGL